MTIVHESDSYRADHAQPATHALLVACEDYPDLHRVGSPARLTATANSAQAMAQWLLGRQVGARPIPPEVLEYAFHNPDAPLGTLAMLTSPAGPVAGLAQPVERSSLANIKQAYREWVDRLNDHPHNRGIFYFCGHGLGDGVTQFLVADDIGEDQNDPWAGLFHVSNTCHATIRKTGASLLYLIDACMEFSPQQQDQLDEPHGLLPGNRTGDPLCTEWSVLRATTTNRLAYAPAGGIARFTQAVLKALCGHVGDQRPGQALYDVSLGSLRGGVGAFLAQMQKPDDRKVQKMGLPQGDGNGEVVFHTLKKRPSALVELDVAPIGYRQAAEAFIERAGQPMQDRQLRQMQGEPARFEVPWGEWSFGAQGPFGVRDCRDQFIARPVLSHRFDIS